jgi:hypothetical protein
MGKMPDWGLPGEPLLGKAIAEQLPKFFDADGATKAAQQRRWEHRIVGELLKFYGLVRHAPMLVADAKAQTGHGRLTLEAFHQFQPGFPFWLTAEKLPNVYKTTMTDFARNFLKTRMYDAFVEAEVNKPRRYLVSGLVFEWLHVWQTAIIHNCFREMKTEGLVIYYNIPRTGQYMAVQSFSSFLESLPWSPD